MMPIKFLSFSKSSPSRDFNKNDSSYKRWLCKSFFQWVNQKIRGFIVNCKIVFFRWTRMVCFDMNLQQIVIWSNWVLFGFFSKLVDSQTGAIFPSSTKFRKCFHTVLHSWGSPVFVLLGWLIFYYCHADIPLFWTDLAKLLVWG